MTNLANLAFQLYSARFEPSLDEKLKTLADLGYELVEPYGGLYETLKDLCEGMTRYGLRARTGHFGFAALREDIDRTIEIAKALQMEIAIIGALPRDERQQDIDGWKSVARSLEEFGQSFRAADLRLAWHNHAYEFVELEDGLTPLDHLLGDAPSVLWQPDIGWIYRGGQDPAVWFSKFGDRVVSVHLKDIAPAGACLDEDGWADLGHGVLDWSELWPAVAELRPEVFTVEHDKPSNYERFAQRSLAAFRRLTEGS